MRYTVEPTYHVYPERIVIPSSDAEFVSTVQFRSARVKLVEPPISTTNDVEIVNINTLFDQGVDVHVRWRPGDCWDAAGRHVLLRTDDVGVPDWAIPVIVVPRPYLLAFPSCVLLRAGTETTVRAYAPEDTPVNLLDVWCDSGDVLARIHKQDEVIVSAGSDDTPRVRQVHFSDSLGRQGTLKVKVLSANSSEGG